MNNAKKAFLYFKELALSLGYKYKVAGDNAYSTKPMGQGGYFKLISCINDSLTYFESRTKSGGFRYTVEIPKTFQPTD